MARRPGEARMRGLAPREGSGSPPPQAFSAGGTEIRPAFQSPVAMKCGWRRLGQGRPQREAGPARGMGGGAPRTRAE